MSDYYDELTKTCVDYSLVGITRTMTLHENNPHYHVNRDGRRVFSAMSEREAAMFAEELYERIQLVRAAQYQKVTDVAAN